MAVVGKQHSPLVWYQGNKGLILPANGLIFGIGNSTVRSGSVNPSSSATEGEPGSLYLNSTTGVVYRKTDSGSSTNWVALDSGLGDKRVRSTRFASISTYPSGTVTLPSNATVILNDFGGTVDAVVTTLSGSKPTFEPALTSSGTIVATSFDGSGNYTLTGTPADASVAIVYRVYQTWTNFDSTASDIIGEYDIEGITGASSVGAGSSVFKDVNGPTIRIRSLVQGSNITLTENANDITIASTGGGVSDHGGLTGLSDDDHTQYALLAGRSGGQSLTGGTASGDDLTLLSTANVTKGTIFLGTASAYDEANDRLGVGVVAPSVKAQLDGGTGTATYLKFTANATTGQTSSDGFDVGIAATGAAEIRQRENLAVSVYTNNTLAASFSEAQVLTLANDLAVTEGGTGASTAAGAATNLGLGTGDSPQFTAVNVGHATDTTITRVSAGVIAVEGSNVLLASGLGSVTQAYDADLAALAANSTDGLWAHTGAGAGAARTLTGTANQITVTNGTGVAGNPTLSLPSDVIIPTVLTVPNTGLHILDTNATHDLIIAPGSNLTADRTFTLTTGDAARTLDISAASVTVSAFGATLTDDADAAAGRTTLGLGTIATQASSSVSITGGSITGITDLAIADGGTAASTAEAARTNLIVHDDPDGRLTLTSGSPVTASDVTAATSVYYTPYDGDMVPIYNGSSWVWSVFTELTLALDATGAHSGYHQSGKNFDLFVINDAGTLRLGTGPAWTSNTGRGTGAGTTQISRLNGYLVNTVTITIRFGSASGNTVSVAASSATYVGTMRASADGQTEDSKTKRFVWNYFNRRQAAMVRYEDTNTWTYSTGTNRQANGSALNQVEFVRGMDEDAVLMNLSASAVNSTTTQRQIGSGIGLDSTTVYSGLIQAPYVITNSGGTWRAFNTSYVGFPGLGYHYLAWIERGDGTDTQTWQGDAGVPTVFQNGMHGLVMT